MATYNNQHWLLSHIRNSFISTDDTGMCETVMLSDDLPKHFLQKYQKNPQNSHRKFDNSSKSNSRPPEVWLRDVDFICYPGLDQSDDEDMDFASQSFDIQMYPEIGSHRYRSNTAQKLEKMDIARRKAARIKSVKIDDTGATVTVGIAIANEPNFFVTSTKSEKNDIDELKAKVEYRSRLSQQLVNCPKQTQNKFLQYARFDGSAQLGMQQAKNIQIFLNMLPEKDRNYPMKVCVSSTAKIQEVIGFICYKCQIQYPDVPLQSVRHYGLYITEDNGEMEDFPPLDIREPCSKFGFTHLTLAERRPSASISRIDYRSLSMTSEAETVSDAAISDIHGISSQANDTQDMQRMLGHNDMIDAPLYRTYRLTLNKGFFKDEVQLGISGERIEIDPVQQKNSKFWTKLKATSYNIESIAYCELFDKRNQRAIVRLWHLNPNSIPSDIQLSSTIGLGPVSGSGAPLLTASPQHYSSFVMPSVNLSHPTNFKYSDFETDPVTAQQIFNKINFILEVRTSAIRKEFLNAREKKKNRQTKKFVK